MNKGYFIVFCFIITFLIGGTSVYLMEDQEYLEANLAIKEANEAKIEANMKEIERLENEIEYQGSKEFVEKIAREELGFVMKDEIIFNVKRD